MNKEMNFKVAPTMTAPTAAIRRIEPKLRTDCSKCEGNINVGMFFDGTNNNRDADRPKLKHTNVVRLFDAYLDQPRKGYFPVYIPGVGTPFPEIGEKGESSLGSGFGIGCEKRVLYALLYVVNALHRSAFDNNPFLSDSQVSALCCSNFVQWSANGPERMALNRIGPLDGLLMPIFGGEGTRVKVLKALAKLLQTALIKGRPVIKECFIDVFGFSRGAAEARVFCSWLDEILTDGMLAGVMVHLRFVGLMDTVASAGFVSSVRSAITGADGGHSGWAESRYLRVPAAVQNCVHMIAAHELRKNFPIDTIIVDGKLSAHCQEFMYPGAHCDVGGGYAPGDLGIAFDRNRFTADSCKLAQIPLNHMLECAVAAGAPMAKASAKGKETAYDPFALSPAVQEAYNDFVTCSSFKPRPVNEWLQPYLNWRWEVRNFYASLTHLQKANEKDRDLLLRYNKQLIADAADLEHSPKPPGLVNLLISPIGALKQQFNAAMAERFESEAAAVLAIAKGARRTDDRLCVLFDRYVHDSLAGFDHINLELSGYWRYRRGFLGSEKKLVVENDRQSDADRAVA